MRMTTATASFGGFAAVMDSSIIRHVFALAGGSLGRAAAADLVCAQAGAPERWSSARASTARASRAVREALGPVARPRSLSATATVVRRAGLRPRGDLTQPPVRVGVVPDLRVPEVAPTTGRRRRVPLPPLRDAAQLPLATRGDLS